MKLTVRELDGCACHVVWSGDKSPVSLSLYAQTDVATNAPPYGALSYSVPSGRQDSDVSTTILIPSHSLEFRDSSTRLSYLVAKRVCRPVFVNSSVNEANSFMFKKICDLVSELIDAHQE